MIEETNCNIIHPGTQRWHVYFHNGGAAVLLEGPHYGVWVANSEVQLIGHLHFYPNNILHHTYIYVSFPNGNHAYAYHSWVKLCAIVIFAANIAQFYDTVNPHAATLWGTETFCDKWLKDKDIIYIPPSNFHTLEPDLNDSSRSG